MIKIIKLSLVVFFYIPWGIVQFFLHYLTKIIPKQKNLILFGSWEGYQLRGNVKHLFIYMLKNEKRFECIWITKNKKLYNEMKNNNLPCLYWMSLRGIIKTVRAKIFFVSHGHHDINYYLSGGAIVINLMHFVYLLKKGGKLVYGTNFLKKFYIILQNPLHYLISPVDYYLCVSPFTANFVENLYDIPSKKTLINYGIKKDFLLTKNKNDFIFDFEKNKILNINKDKKNIFFLPTHRKRDVYEIFNYNFNPELLNDILKNNNAMLYINFHPLTYRKKFSFIEKYSNIKILESKGDENNLIIDQFDMLITDYSSIYVDFLLFDKPIILAPFDFKSYIKSERKIISNYFNLPSPIAKDWNELTIKIQEFLHDDADKYREERKKLKDTIYTDITRSGLAETVIILKKLVKI
tara:strand:+ start:2056 stop:3279 length:1224 start_codon:yes stop_codon:yes gene_type:complete